MVDVKEMPITFTPNQPAKLSACNTTEVRLYLYIVVIISMAITRMHFSLSKNGR